MRIGVFAKVFVRPTLADVFDAVRGAGLDTVQFNMSCAGLPTLPEAIEESRADEIAGLARERGITLAAVSGTFNMIHPDRGERRAGLARLGVLLAACRRLGVPLVTLCTGSRDPSDMWRRHADNDRPDAWRDLVESLNETLRVAADHGVTLGVEPEVSNVIDSAAKCRRLLDELGSPYLKAVLDGANLFHAGQLPRMRDILDEACDLLAGDIALAHAKDLAHDGEAGDRAAGTGVLDYAHYLAGLRRARYDGPLILHGLKEAEVAASVAFLKEVDGRR